MLGRRLAASALVAAVSTMVLASACSGSGSATQTAPSETRPTQTTSTAASPADGSSAGTPDTTTANTSASTAVQATRDVVPVELGEVWGLIDVTGAWVAEPQFASFPFFSEGLAAVQAVAYGQPGAWGFIDRTGAWVVEPQFANARSFTGGVAPVAVRTKDNRMFWGFIDKKGAWVIEPRFRDAWPFSEGLASAQQHPEKRGATSTASSTRPELGRSSHAGQPPTPSRTAPRRYRQGTPSASSIGRVR